MILKCLPIEWVFLPITLCDKHRLQKVLIKSNKNTIHERDELITTRTYMISLHPKVRRDVHCDIRISIFFTFRPRK